MLDDKSMIMSGANAGSVVPLQEGWAVCPKCGELLIVAQDLSVRRMTLNDEMTVPENVLRDMYAYSSKIRGGEELPGPSGAIVMDLPVHGKIMITGIDGLIQGVGQLIQGLAAELGDKDVAPKIIQKLNEVKKDFKKAHPEEAAIAENEVIDDMLALLETLCPTISPLPKDDRVAAVACVITSFLTAVAILKDYPDSYKKFKDAIKPVGEAFMRELEAKRNRSK